MTDYSNHQENMQINWDQLSPFSSDQRGLGLQTETKLTFRKGTASADGKVQPNIAVRISERDMVELGWAYGDKIRGFIDEATATIVYLRSKDSIGMTLSPHDCSYKGLEGQVGIGEVRHRMKCDAERLAGVDEWASQIGFRDDIAEHFLCFRPVMSTAAA